MHNLQNKVNISWCSVYCTVPNTKSLFWIKRKSIKNKPYIFDSSELGKSLFIILIKLLAYFMCHLFHKIVGVWSIGACLTLKQRHVVLLTICLHKLLLLLWKIWIERWIYWHISNSWSWVERDDVIWIMEMRLVEYRRSRWSYLLVNVLVPPWIWVRKLLF